MGRSVARLVSVLVIAGSATLLGHPARACSCAPTQVAQVLPSADGAFIGTFVERAVVAGSRAAMFTFEVERVIKGAFGPIALVRSSADGASCGLEFFGEPRTGLLLTRADDGVWESSLCQMASPSELLAVGGHPPDPAIAPVSAGGSVTMKGVLLAGLLGILLVGLGWRYVRRSATSPPPSDVA